MTITNGYCTLPELQTRLGIDDDDDNAALEVAIESASREIDDFCRRRFWLDLSATARTYRFVDGLAAPGVACIHDYDPATAITVKSDDDADGVFETTWTSGTDYVAEPLNANVYETGPKNELRLLGTRYLRPSIRGRAQLQVTAAWGWPAVPTPVKQACEILAMDLFKSKDAPFGVAGSSEFGVLRIRDNFQASALLRRYRLDVFGIA